MITYASLDIYWMFPVQILNAKFTKQPETISMLSIIIRISNSLSLPPIENIGAINIIFFTAQFHSDDGGRSCVYYMYNERKISSSSSFFDI